MGCLRVIIAKTGDVYETSELGPKRRIQRVELFSFGFLNSTSVQFFKGTCGMGRNENGTVRERETMGYFVPDREFPTRPVVVSGSFTVPLYVSCSRPDCFLFHCCLPICCHPMLTFAHKFLPLHLPPVFSFSDHVTMEATGLCSFGCNRVRETGAYRLVRTYIYQVLFFLFPPPLQSPPYHAGNEVEVEYQPFNRSYSQPASL